MSMRILAGVLTAAAMCNLADGGALSLEGGFRSPPDSAKPQTWYHIMNGNVTKEGITRDFEEIAKAGLGGVQIFDVGCDIPPGTSGSARPNGSKCCAMPTTRPSGSA